MTNDSAKALFFLVLLCLAFQGFFALMELACLSVNKLRVQYYVSQGDRRAKMLSYLLNRPTLLFGTSLIGLNAGLILGSEAARKFYAALGLSPDLAPLSQVIIVLIFAELSPMLAGRMFSESASMMGAPFLYICSWILRPIVWFCDFICFLISKSCGIPVNPQPFLTREELQKVIEFKDEGVETDNAKMDQVVDNIFQFRYKTAQEVMQPISSTHVAPSRLTVGELEQFLKGTYSSFVPLYLKEKSNIVAIAYPRDLLRLQDNANIRDYAKTPWFIAQEDSIFHILRQFRHNNQIVAVVLDEKGLATGILTLDEIVDEIFGRKDDWIAITDGHHAIHHVVIDRSFSGDTLVAAFNREYQQHLVHEPGETLEELMGRILGHSPLVSDAIRVDQFELSVSQAPLIGAKLIHIRTID